MTSQSLIESMWKCGETFISKVNKQEQENREEFSERSEEPGSKERKALLRTRKE